MKTVQLSFEGQKLTLELYTSISELKNEWAQVASLSDDVFLEAQYLTALELNPPDRMEFYYVLVKQENKICGIFYFQARRFTGRQTLTYLNVVTLKDHLTVFFKRFLSLFINIKGLVLGNLLVTGEHAYSFSPDFDSNDNEIGLALAVFEKVNGLLKAEKKGTSLFMVKDFPSENIEAKNPFHGVQVQPDMVLYLKNEWLTFDDYLSAMKPKYRKRMRAAERKAAGFEIKELSFPEVQKYTDEIFALYMEIVQRASFNMFILNKNYFAALKEYLDDKCIVNAFFLDGKLEAFQINIQNGKLWEAHFLGYNPLMVKTHDLYLNLLLMTVKNAINRRSGKINFSRTAMQIKSSIGAIPEQLTILCGVKYKRLNNYFPQIIKRFEPDYVFDQRHPFKA